MRLALLAGGLVGCQWLNDLGTRADLDGDGFGGPVDCNDGAPDLALLDEVDALPVACGDRIEGELAEAPDVLRVVPCEDPTREGQYVALGTHDQLFRLDVERPTEVEIELEASEIGIATPSVDQPRQRYALLAIQGPRCTTEACLVGLPERPADRTAAWAPTAHFTANVGAPWYVIVSGEAFDEVAAFTLDVRCHPEGSPP